MSNSLRLFSLFVAAASAVVFAGCSKEPVAPPVVAEEEVTNQEIIEEVEVPALTDDVTDTMSGLSDADRAAAVAQKICPVSDEALGSMGTPLKVTVEGRDVFICCEGCRDQLQADPDKFLAKLAVNKAP